MTQDSFQQNDSSMPTGGPQFGLEEKEGWISKYGGSIVLPIIALLILAGGIYLYASQQSSEEVGPSAEEEELPVVIGDELTEEVEEFQGIEIENLKADIGEPIASIAEEDDGKIIIEKIIPESRKIKGNIIEVAAQGDGVTHLARRALQKYLSDSPQELTNEHKVYIEDYLKDKTGSEPLEVGDEISFSESLISEAIDASLQLTPDQLEKLEQYSALVAW